MKRDRVEAAEATETAAGKQNTTEYKRAEWSHKKLQDGRASAVPAAHAKQEAEQNECTRSIPFH